MPQYSYKAKAGPSQITSGVVQAENKLVVIKKLRQEGLFPVSIDEINPAPAKKGFRRVNPRDISAFTRQLANLIHSGFLLSTALLTLSQQTQNQPLKKLINDLYDMIQKGATFSDALSVYPEIFSSFYVNITKVGEASGKIDQALEKLANFKEREDELLSQVTSALVYPAFLFSLGIITIFILITFFFPRLSTMFSSLGQALPLPTQILIHASSFMHRFWWLFVVAVTAAVIIARSYYKKEKNRLLVDRLILRIPLLKGVVQKVEIARFSYALAVLLGSGIPMLEALGVVGLSVENRLFRQKISSFQEKIRKGQSLSKCLQAEGIFPPILINMVAVGEESGELTDMLSRIAATFEADVNRTVKTMVSLIEPILILFIGGIVVLMVFSMLMPIFQMDFISR